MLKKASVLLCFLKSELRKQLQRKKQYLTELSEYLQAFPTVVLSKFDWIKVVTCHLWYCLNLTGKKLSLVI